MNDIYSCIALFLFFYFNVSFTLWQNVYGVHRLVVFIQKPRRISFGVKGTAKSGKTETHQKTTECWCANAMVMNKHNEI